MAVENPSLNKASLLIYPNPTRDKIFIKDLPPSSSSQLNIYDMLGKIVMTTKITATDYSNGIDVSALNLGIYHLEIVPRNNGGEFFRARWVKVD